MPQNPNDAQDSPQMDEVLAEFIRRRDAGEPVDVESLCAARPDLADALRSYADGEDLLREMALDDSVPAGSAVAETMRPGAMRDTDSLIAGRVLGNYRLIRQLGQGAMGAVYLAEDTTLQRQAAVKVPKFSPADGSDARERFFREARAAAALNHPQICPVFHADEVQGTPFIAMAFINGQPLSRFVGTADFQDQRRIAEVLRLVADGLQHAHERGIVHRDLKPGNIMLDQQGQPVVTDFGLARRLVQEQESRITQEGQILGTPAYMSPEQITGNLDKLTSATDIYALGVVLFELLTGRLPFQGNAPAVIAAALHTQPPKPSSLRADVDPELEALCLQMLRKEAAQRPKSMREVGERLAKWLEKPAPPSAAEQAAAKQLRTELEAEQQKIKQSIRSGQFQAALKQLQTLARRNEPAAAEFRKWAAEQIPRVKALPAKMKRDEPEMVRMAQDWMKRHDYEQAIQILRSIPDLCRSDETEELLQQAVELQEESDDLLLHLKNCVQKRQYDGIEADAKRLLELKPGNQFAKNLWEKLHSYRGVPAASRRYRFDNKGRLLPMNDGSEWTRNLILAGLTGLLVFGLMTWGIVIYLRNDDQTLAVEVDDEWLKEQGGQLTLSVDGQEHHLTGPGFDIKVALGDRGFSVKKGDSVVHNPQTFTIAKAGRQILRINGSGMHLVGWASPTNDPTTVNATNGQSSPDAAPVEIDAPLTPLPDGPPGFIRTLDGHTGIITGLAFAPDGRTLVSVSATDGTLRIWDIESGETRHAIKAGIGYGTAIHPDGKSILVSISDYVENHPILYDINTGGVLAKFPGLGGPVFSCAFSPNGKYAALEADKHGVKVYDVSDLATQSLVAEFPGGSSGPASAIEFLPDNEHVIESTYSGTRLLHVPSKREIRRYLSDGKSSGTTSLTMAVRPDGKHFFIRNSVTWEVVGYDVAQDTPVERFANVRDLPRYSPDGLHLICFQDHDPKKGTPLALTVRSPKSGATVWQASLTEQTQPHTMKLSAVSPDGRYVVLGGMSDISQNGAATIKGIPNPLYLWRLPKSVWPKLKSEVGRAVPANSPATNDATNGGQSPPYAAPIVIAAPLTPLPDGATGLVKQLVGHTSQIHDLAMSPGGETVCSISEDMTMRLWNLSDGKEIWNQKLDAAANSVAFHPSGRHILLATWQLARICDAETGKVVFRLTQEPTVVFRAAWSNDGQRLATLSKDGVRVWGFDGTAPPSLIHHVAIDMNHVPSALAFCRNPSHLLVGQPSKGGDDPAPFGLRLYDIETGKELRRYLDPVTSRPIEGGSDDISVTPGGDIVAFKAIKMPGHGWDPVLFDIESGRIVRHPKSQGAPQFSPTGRYLATGDEDDIVLTDETDQRVWQVQSKLHNGHRLAFTPDGRYLISAGGWYWDHQANVMKSDSEFPISIWRLPKEMWPKLK